MNWLWFVVTEAWRINQLTETGNRQPGTGVQAYFVSVRTIYRFYFNVAFMYFAKYRGLCTLLCTC